MDDLFKMAGEQYPLDTNSADWSKVRSALDNAKPDSPLKQRKEMHRAVYLLFLIPFALICNQIYDVGVNNIGKQPGQDLPSQNTAISTGSLPAVENNSIETSVEAVPSSDNLSTINNSVGNSFGNTTRISSSSTTSVHLLVPAVNADNKVSTTSLANSQTSSNTNDKIVGVESSKQKDNTSIETNQLKDIPSVSEPNTNNSVKEEKQEEAIETKSQQSTAATKKPSVKEKRFYAAALFGPDITTVKLQKITNAGLDFGLLLGFNINNKLSMETGIISSRKEYYASGEYLTKYSAYLPSNIKVTYGEGSCRMIELPIQAKYTFNPGSKNNWFLAAGTSSYFMKEEDYEYYYKNMTTGVEWSRDREYKTSSSSYIAVAEISGGISKPLGKFGDLRVQPYLKLPLKKVGYNELPLTSGGIHLVFSKELF